MAGKRKKSVIPGFGLTMGITTGYLGLIVLFPLACLFFQTLDVSLDTVQKTVFSGRALAAFGLSFGASFAAACVNTVFGFLVAWVLVRYTFPGRFLVDAMVDLPFALPTAVAGISLTFLYAQNGWLGKFLYGLGIPSVYSRIGVFIALIFIGLPFVVRTVQPVLVNFDTQVEEAAASLGASRFKAFTRVIMPEVLPSAITGFALAFARALGEYGSVVFISGNMPHRTEIVPLLIMTRLEEYDYLGAQILAVVMLVLSFCFLFLINFLQYWGQRHHRMQECVA